jgi:hypothetical protein
VSKGAVFCGDESGGGGGGSATAADSTPLGESGRSDDEGEDDEAEDGKPETDSSCRSLKTSSTSARKRLGLRSSHTDVCLGRRTKTLAAFAAETPSAPLSAPAEAAGMALPPLLGCGVCLRAYCTATSVPASRQLSCLKVIHTTREARSEHKEAKKVGRGKG